MPRSEYLIVGEGLGKGIYIGGQDRRCKLTINKLLEIVRKEFPGVELDKIVIEVTKEEGEVLIGIND